MSGQERSCITLMGLAVLTWAGGCVHGPAVLQLSRARYGQVIQQTSEEQLLLNLVRLQYREAPIFLDVGSVSAQFTFERSASAGGTIIEGPGSINPDRLDLRVGVEYQEKPTITFTPLDGTEFVNQLLAPLEPDRIVLLSRSGWSIDRVMRLMVQSMNDLDNASSASGPTPVDAPHFATFARVCRLLRTLQKEGLLELGYEVRKTDLSDPLPAERVDLADLVDAHSQGYGVRFSEDDKHLILTGTSRVLVWRVPPEAADSPEVAEIVNLLGLMPGQSDYPVDAGGGRCGLEAKGRRTKINLVTRSLMGTLFYLAQAVEVPAEHRQRGLVTMTLKEDGTPFDWTTVTDRLLRVHTRSTPPSGAAVAVKYRGHSYYIDDADLSSKSTFTLLGELFALQAAGPESAAPLLTLPIGG